MRQKIEIKVYLPYMMVGELESMKKRGMRSKFIESAIRTKLDGEESFRPQDLSTRRVIALLLARYPDDDVLRTILLDRMPPLEGVE